MFCRECGKELMQDAKFCSYCGTQVAQVDQSQESSLYQPQKIYDTNINTGSVNKEYERLHQMYINKSTEELLQILNLKNEYSSAAVLAASDILKNERGITEELVDKKSILFNDQNSQNAIQEAPYNTMCILGLVLSCISLFINFWGIMGIVSIVLSTIGLLQIQQKHENGKFLAIIGIIIGSCSIIYAFIIIMDLITL